jgi:hypothetical protein
MKRLLTTIVLGLASCALPSFAEEKMESARMVYDVSDHLAGAGAFNVLTFNAPRDLKVSELGLREAGLRAAESIIEADEIRIWNSQDDMEASPAARIYIHAGQGGRYWYQTGGEGSAEDHVIRKGQAVVVYTRVADADIAWSNPFRADEE